MTMKLNKLFAAVGINKPSQAVKTAKSAAAVVAKEAPKASAADAMASQGKAMVNMSEVKYANAKSQKATSDSWGGNGDW